MREIIKKWKIVGHRKRLEYLAKILEQKHFPQALIFNGPKQIGKFTIAKRFAQTLICAKSNFCGQCADCRQVAKNSHPDLLVLANDPIVIDDIRKLISFSYRTPLKAPLKAVIIKNAEKLTTEASNAFLKLLEEPPMDTIFILTTQNASTLLPTIISRCQVINFSLVNFETMINDLIKLDYQKEEIEKVVAYTQGCPGIFFNCYQKPKKLAEIVEQEKEFIDFLIWPIQKRLDHWERMLKNSRLDLGEYIDHWISFIQQAISSQSPSNQLQPLEKESLVKLKQNLKLLLLTKEAVKSSGNIKLNLDNLSVQL